MAHSEAIDPLASRQLAAVPEKLTVARTAPPDMDRWAVVVVFRVRTHEAAVSLRAALTGYGCVVELPIKRWWPPGWRWEVCASGPRIPRHPSAITAPEVEGWLRDAIAVAAPWGARLQAWAPVPRLPGA
jgi:hypothetical protein